MNPTFTLRLCACLIVLTTSTGLRAEALPEFDHHDPVALNEAAMRYLKVGAGGTALILLERACILQPHNPVLQANLSALRIHLANPGQLSATPGKIEAAAEIPVQPLLPSPWPAKAAP